ncbi:MAG: hypothetical protein LDL06_04490, partial [Candidatus Nitrosotenuis sp.]|nr:hypothetical protein [Candidatus Nitrosotenuis sp.]
VDKPITFAAIFEFIQMEFMRQIDSSSAKVYEECILELEYIIQNILKHTFYVEKPTSDWNDFVIEYFYPKDEDREFFLEFRDGEFNEAKLLYRIMRAVHFGFFSALKVEAPAQTQKIPYSKKWKAFKKNNPEYSSPKDFDKKRHQIVDYLAGYRVS